MNLLTRLEAAAQKQAELDRAQGNIPGVYAITSGAFVKIGRARKSIRERLRNLQTASAEPMELLAVVSFDPDEERGCQARMARFRARGEWFDLTDESIVEIATMAVECGWAEPGVLT